MADVQDVSSASVDELRLELEDLRLLHRIAEGFNSTIDFDELLPQVFNDILDAVGAQGGSIWIAHGDMLRCELALGSASQKLLGTDVPVGTGFVGDVAQKQRSTLVSEAMKDKRFQEHVDRSSQMITTTLIAAPMVTRGTTVGAIQVANKRTGIGVFEDRDRRLLEGLASAAAVALRNGQLRAAERKARDLSLLLDISREITSTLNVDHVLAEVVNQASRALSFDQGAIGTFARTKCQIRAIAGEQEVDQKSDRVKRLAARGEWATERGEIFYLVDRTAPSSQPEEAFVQAFGDALESDEMKSGLYLPLKDEQGTLGVLIFESKEADFAGDTQRELGEILANQAAVALRNAELYNQVPLADALGSLARKKRQLMQLPKRRLQIYAALAAIVLAAATLIRWPLRVAGLDPTFRAATLQEVRPLVSGVVERILVAEGTNVARGTPIVQLRDFEMRAEREALAAELMTAELGAADAASSGDRVRERIQRNTVTSLRREIAILDEQIEATIVLAPVEGTVLTPRPEELVGIYVEAGDPVLTIGRTDLLELEFGVPQRDIHRVQPTQGVRLRVASLPQRTFAGTVTSIAVLPIQVGEDMVFLVRAEVPNTEGVFKPGMQAYARVLTGPTSLAVRVLRGPARWGRLLWWRMMP